MKTHFHSAALCFIGIILHHWHALTGKVYGKVFSSYLSKPPVFFSLL